MTQLLDTLDFQYPHFIYGAQRDLKSNTPKSYPIRNNNAIKTAQMLYKQFLATWKCRPYAGGNVTVYRELPLNRMPEDIQREFFEIVQTFVTHDVQQGSKFIVVSHIYTAGLDPITFGINVGDVIAQAAGDLGLQVVIGTSWIHPELYTYIAFAKDNEHLNKMQCLIEQLNAPH